jgi:arginine/lysine/ornithine decarboxylase
MSLHKTLPALTQTALLHVQGTRVNLPRLEHQLRVFHSSSPSYVLLASMERCIALLEAHWPAWQSAWAARLDSFYAQAAQWQRLRLCGFGRDRGKLWIDAGDAAQAAAFLRTRGIEPEYARGRHLLCLTSPCDTEDMMAALAAALAALDRLPCQALPLPATPAPAGALALPLARAMELPRERLPMAQAVGRVSADYVWEYPPGIPLLLPGQIITQELPQRAELDVLCEGQRPRANSSAGEQDKKSKVR